MNVIAGGQLLNSFEITRTTMRNYEFMGYIQMSTTLQVAVSDGGPVVIDRVCMYPSNPGALGGDYGIQYAVTGVRRAGSPVAGLDVSEVLDAVEALDVQPVYLDLLDAAKIRTLLLSVLKYGVTVINLMSPKIIGVWFGARIALIAALWFFAFVMRRIGLRIPLNDSYINQHVQNVNDPNLIELLNSNRWYNLGDMPSSGLGRSGLGPRIFGGRRGRRRRW
jgi:hypothetical protein